MRLALLTALAVLSVGATPSSAIAQDPAPDSVWVPCLNCTDVSTVCPPTSPNCHQHGALAPMYDLGNGSLSKWVTGTMTAHSAFTPGPGQSYLNGSCADIHDVCGWTDLGEGTCDPDDESCQGDGFGNEAELLTSLDAAVWEEGGDLSTTHAMVAIAPVEYTVRRIPVGVELIRWCEQAQAEVRLVVPMPMSSEK